MNLSKLHDWLGLLANIGVIGGLIFLGLEIQQNTKIQERQISIDRTVTNHGVFVNSNELVALLIKIQDVNPTSPRDLINQLKEQYNFTDEEAVKWLRYLMQVWEQNQADWIYDGRRSNECPQAELLLNLMDHKIFFDSFKGIFDEEYAACALSKMGQ